jgi:hypothetical protein
LLFARLLAVKDCHVMAMLPKRCGKAGKTQGLRADGGLIKILDWGLYEKYVHGAISR